MYIHIICMHTHSCTCTCTCTHTHACTHLVSCKDLKGSQHLFGGVLVNCLPGHEVHKQLKGDMTGLVGVNFGPQIIKAGIIVLMEGRKRGERGGEGREGEKQSIQSNNLRDKTHRITPKIVAQAEKAGAVFVLVQHSRIVLKIIFFKETMIKHWKK